jgi:hypothetical protein
VTVRELAFCKIHGYVYVIKEKGIEVMVSGYQSQLPGGG